MEVLIIDPETTLQACPWAHFSSATMEFCEARLCDWVVEPANAWSNMIVILVGLIILFKAKTRQGSLLPMVGISTILLGLGSFFMHASATFVGQIADLFGMFLVLAVFLGCELQRSQNWPFKKILAVVSFLAIAPTGIIMLNDSIGIPMFAVLLVWVIYLCYSNAKAATKKHSTKFLTWGVIAFLLGFTFWVLDVSKILCAPHNHWINGHAVWHALSAAAIYCFYLYEEQFIHADNA